MKLILVILAVLLFAAWPALGWGPYGWTISSSGLSPDVNSGHVTSAPFSLYLWFKCSIYGDGMSAAEFDFAVPPGTSILGFSTTNGFLNAGGPTNLLLAVGGCPVGPVVAGSWTLFGSTPGSFCLVNSAADDLRITVDCNVPIPQVWPINAQGFGYGAQAPESCVDIPVCGVVSTEPKSWGSVKTLYR